MENELLKRIDRMFLRGFSVRASAHPCPASWPSVNFDDSRGMWTNEGFLIEPYPSFLLDDGFMNRSAFIKNGEVPASYGLVSKQ